jgi:hypothetical protein
MFWTMALESEGTVYKDTCVVSDGS